MANTKVGCRHCGGSLVRVDDEVKCLSCGRPAENTHDMCRYYEEHKKDIKADILEIGVAATIEKWRIPKGPFNKLRDRWLPLEEQKPIGQRKPPADNHMPRLPDFKDSWGPTVQELWLKIWLYIATSKE